MKTESVSLSLPKELAEFIRQEMKLEAYGTINEYLRELVRQRRQSRIDADVKFLESVSAGAPNDEPPQNFFDDVSAVQKRVRGEKKPLR
jgi:Arc/MetJ-type ribon-helix-helix transcriptional regulator